MVLVLLILSAIGLFLAAAFVPHKSKKIQKEVDVNARKLHRKTGWLWDPIMVWARGTIEFIRRVFTTMIKKGKHLRQKLPF